MFRQPSEPPYNPYWTLPALQPKFPGLAYRVEGDGDWGKSDMHFNEEVPEFYNTMHLIAHSPPESEVLWNIFLISTDSDISIPTFEFREENSFVLGVKFFLHGPVVTSMRIDSASYYIEGGDDDSGRFALQFHEEEFDNFLKDFGGFGLEDLPLYQEYAPNTKNPGFLSSELNVFRPKLPNLEGGNDLIPYTAWRSKELLGPHRWGCFGMSDGLNIYCLDHIHQFGMVQKTEPEEVITIARLENGILCAVSFTQARPRRIDSLYCARPERAWVPLE